MLQYCVKADADVRPQRKATMKAQAEADSMDVSPTWRSSSAPTTQLPDDNEDDVEAIPCVLAEQTWARTGVFAGPSGAVQYKIRP
jgi:hypothetical protein